MIQSFSFAVIADLHCSEEGDSGIAGASRLGRCVELIAELEPAESPDFLFLLGDIHLWSLDPASLRAIDIPVHAVAGNHEYGRERKEQLHASFPHDFRVDGEPSDYYSFVHKGVRFVVVCDAGAGGDHVGHLASQDIRPHGQFSWLEAELTQPEERKVVFAHIPPHPHGLEDDMSMGPHDARSFNALVARTRPTAMFFGHQHLPTRTFSIGDTQAFVLPSAAWNFEDAPAGFMVARLGAEGVTPREIQLAE
ncbi:metallophosphoesterase family protein [Candidatus Latescibacterota bacterium]